MPRPVVIDACVLVPISLCDILLELAHVGLFSPLWSLTILDELRRALINDVDVPVSKADSRIERMRQAFPDSMVTGFEALIPQMKNHPKDRHVLAVAVKAGCDLITTVDRGGFARSALDPFGVSVIDPDAFLVSLLDEDEAAVLVAAHTKRRSYHRPPMSMVEFCAHIGRLVPNFSSRVLTADGQEESSGRIAI